MSDIQNHVLTDLEIALSAFFFFAELELLLILCCLEPVLVKLVLRVFLK